MVLQLKYSLYYIRNNSIMNLSLLENLGTLTKLNKLILDLEYFLFECYLCISNNLISDISFLSS